MGADKSTSSGGGKSRKTPVQTYEQFKTPEGRAAAVQRQQKILDSTRTKTGAFANQEADLKKGILTKEPNASAKIEDEDLV